MKPGFKGEGSWVHGSWLIYSMRYLLGGRAARSIQLVKLKLCITALKDLGHHFLFIRNNTFLGNG